MSRILALQASHIVEHGRGVNRVYIGDKGHISLIIDHYYTNYMDNLGSGHGLVVRVLDSGL